MKRWWRSALGFALGLFARTYLATLRVRVVADVALQREDATPWVLCFWHGEQVPLLHWKRRRPTVALVSHSHDGQMQSQILQRLGMLVERGSTSRGGARGLLRVVRALRAGCDAAFAVDGPRGPRYAVASGARVAAQRSQAHLVPMASYAPHGWTLTRSWDRLRFPWPFSTVFVRLGAPLDALAMRGELARAIQRCSELAAGDARAWPTERDEVAASAAEV